MIRFRARCIQVESHLCANLLIVRIFSRITGAHLFAMRFSLLPLLLWASLAHAQEDLGYWDDIKGIVFEDRMMLDGSAYIEADVPKRAENDLRQILGAHLKSPDRTPIKKVYLVLDENPMPVSLQITPEHRK